MGYEDLLFDAGRWLRGDGITSAQREAQSQEVERQQRARGPISLSDEFLNFVPESLAAGILGGQRSPSPGPAQPPPATIPQAPPTPPGRAGTDWSRSSRVAPAPELSGAQDDPAPPPDRDPLTDADSYLRFAWGGGKPQDVGRYSDIDAPRYGQAPEVVSGETVSGLMDRSYKPRPNAFSGMAGGIQTQGQLEQDAKAEGQFNDRWDARRDQIDAEEQSTADRYLRGAKNARELEMLGENPYEAYARRADIDRQKAVGIATGTEEAKDAVRGRREQSIQSDLNAINQEIATIDADLSQIDTDPRYLALPPERQAAAKAQLAQKKAEQESRRDARIQAAGIATGNAPGQMFKRDDDIPGGN